MVINLKKSIYDKYNIEFDKIRGLIEPFIVEFEGEDKKEEISKRLDRVVLNNYFNLKDIQRFIQNSKSKKRRALSLDFLELLEEGVSFSEEDKNRMIYDESYYKEKISFEQSHLLKELFDSIDCTFVAENFSPIYSLFEAEENGEELSEYRLSELKRRTCKVLNALGLEIDTDNYEEVLARESSKETILKARSIKEIALNLRDEYILFVSQFQEEEQYFKECQNIHDELHLREIKSFYRDIIPYVDKQMQDNIRAALNEDINSSLSFLSSVDKDRLYLSFTLSSPGKIEAFSGENMEKVKENNSYLVKSILQKQEQYFEVFKRRNPGVELTPPSVDMVEKIESIRNKHVKKVEDEYFLRTSSYENSRNLIEGLDLKVNDEFNIESMKNNVICCSPSYRGCLGEITEQPVCLINMPLYNLSSGYIDSYLLHEILHAVELTSRKVDEDTYDFKSGFDFLVEIVDDKKDEAINEEEKRATELFSENIHQRNTIEIVTRMHENGVYLFDNPYTAKERGGTSYEQLNFVTQQFYSQFKKQISEARFESSMDSLFDQVGEENFYKLNDVVNEYSKIPYYTMCQDLAEGNRSEYVIKRERLFEESKQIVDDMKKRMKGKSEIEGENISI